MLRPRVIPCLLVHERGLVKTIGFTQPKYVGDPINAVRIFNEKEVDELIVLDIDASSQRREPDYRMIGHLATECRMPLCYGGGVHNAEQATRIIGLGVEKVAISSAAMEKPGLVEEVAEQVGRQSVVVVLDVRKRRWGGKYEVCTLNGGNRTGRCPVECAVEFERLGAGEIVVNSIDRDGTMKGYDLDLARQVHETVRVPLSIMGGAGKFDDICQLVDAFGIVGVCAGSMFVFKGPYRAVLISYLSQAEREVLASRAAEYGSGVVQVVPS